jgi:transcriptional regulator with XRE-family HTH domain
MGFKENLKAELTYQGILVKELAALSGVNKFSIDNYVNSRSQLPSVESAVKIANALGVSVEYLVTGENSTKVENRISADSRTIVRIVEHFSVQKRKIALGFIKWLQGFEISE